MLRGLFDYCGFSTPKRTLAKYTRDFQSVLSPYPVFTVVAVESHLNLLTTVCFSAEVCQKIFVI